MNTHTHPLMESRSKHMTFRTSEHATLIIRERAKEQGKTVSEFIHDTLTLHL
jgi:uncharacterized protein (DUF1778 family)